MIIRQPSDPSLPFGYSFDTRPTRVIVVDRNQARESDGSRCTAATPDTDHSTELTEGSFQSTYAHLVHIGGRERDVTGYLGIM
jgi:hypothetical protein